jgi:hypothetical protein
MPKAGLTNPQPTETNADDALRFDPHAFDDGRVFGAMHRTQREILGGLIVADCRAHPWRLTADGFLLAPVGSFDRLRARLVGTTGKTVEALLKSHVAAAPATAIDDCVQVLLRAHRKRAELAARLAELTALGDIVVRIEPADRIARTRYASVPADQLAQEVLK